MRTLLVLSFFPAFLPPRSGGEVRLFGLYNMLSRTRRIVLLTSGHVGGEVEVLQHNANFKEVRVPKGPEFAEKWAELQEHAGSGDLSAPCLAALSRTFSELHRRYLQEYQQCDAIIHDSPFLSGYDLFLGFDKKPRIYNSYNVELDIYEQLHRDAKSSLIRDIVRDCEDRLLRHADLVTACSQEDIRGFEAAFGYTRNICLVPNGIDNFSAPEVAIAGKALVFIGSGHRPNVLAAEFIADTLAPALPEYDFHVMGSCLARERSGGNLIVHGPVDDATKARLFSGARASINPMVDGGGSSLKIVDLAANGVPILSTAMGVRGFGMVDGEHYLGFKVDQAVEELRHHLSDAALLERVADQAATHIKTRFTWDAIADVFGQAIDDLAKRTVPRRCFTVLNDYDPFLTVGGGATRIRGLYEAVSEDAAVIVLCFTDEAQIVRREECGGRILVLAIPKTAEQKAEEQDLGQQHHVSAVDIIAVRAAPANAVLTQVFDCSSRFADLVICEHPYMVALPRRSGARFVYSSQNFELQLKRDLLVGHPLYADLMADLYWAESYAVGCAELVVAVSQDDARAIGAAFPLTAPVVVVPNGAAEPLPPAENLEAFAGLNFAFVGSAHMPNIEAARFIVDDLAPALPTARFHILGSSCLGIGEGAPDNVVLWGVIAEQTKADVLSRCDLALNPMSSGSGSNVKVADYLKNGLAVLSTAFGARGYDDQVGGDIVLAELAGFRLHLAAMTPDPANRACENAARRAAYTDKLSMLAWGREFARLMLDKLAVRRRVAFVTYRYNDPPMGGAEAYLQRLIEGLADAGHDVDVISVQARYIIDENRFSSIYPAPAELGPIPVGHPRIRAVKFPVDPTASSNGLQDLWAVQPHYERALHLAFAPSEGAIGLGWGWSPVEGQGRWAHTLFGVYTGRGDILMLEGHAPGKRLLRLTCDSGVALGQWPIEGAFSITVAATGGRVHGAFFARDDSRPADPRPLAAYICSIRVGNQELVAEATVSPWPDGCEHEEIIAAHYRAASVTRCASNVELTAVRGPFSAAMDQYLEQCLSDYDLLLTNNAVFRTATRSIELAHQAGVPSVLVPHLHLDDDYYHFPDIYDACGQADLTLISPRVACKFMNNHVAGNIAYHAPGIDLADTPGEDDVARFREHYPHAEPFFLVLGRKSGAKRYRDVIAAVHETRGKHDVRLVMIGHDEDREPVTDPFVTMLGHVDRAVVRGALGSCVALVNMSVSESFGMVLVEAGHAGVPVLANQACASFRDIVIDGDNGHLVDTATLPVAMAGLLNDPMERDRLGRNGASRARQFGWEAIVGSFVNDCEKLMQQAEK